MASIKLRGKTYWITVSLGFKEDGVTRIRKSTTFKPKYGMTETQAENAANEYAAKFENTCKYEKTNHPKKGDNNGER